MHRPSSRCFNCHNRWRDSCRFTICTIAHRGLEVKTPAQINICNQVLTGLPNCARVLSVEQKLRKEECAMVTLLEQAKQSPPGIRRSRQYKDLPQSLEVAWAYAFGEISGKQFAAVIPGSIGNVSNRTGLILLAAVQAGMLVRKEPL
jgi:hypothetical protein